MRRREILQVAAGSALAMTFSSERGARAAEAVAPLHWDGKTPIRVAVVVGKNATVIDFAGPWETFGDAMLLTGPGDNDMIMPFETAMVSDRMEPLEASNGMIITPRFTYDSYPEQPNVIVMGAQGEHTPEKIAWIREASKKADVVMSVCTGAFLLAKTGLLDGLRATTHHDRYDHFEKEFPKVQLVRGPRYVDNGKFATAGGLTSGFELAFHVVERYMGSKAVRQTAYYMEYNRSPQRPHIA